jgi:predicted enzyme related to lactoylglutathione lyase
MLRTLATISFYAADLAAARRWYTQLLGQEPYFTLPEHDPAYLEWRVGPFDHELGIIDARFAPGGPASGQEGPSSSGTGHPRAITYWLVDDVRAAHGRLLELGATEHEPVTPRGDGFVTASVIDPFGNVLGVMENAHAAAVLARAGAATRQ